MAQSQRAAGTGRHNAKTGSPVSNPASFRVLGVEPGRSPAFQLGSEDLAPTVETISVSAERITGTGL